jgi:endogenous inhibitor of DNA gyrase (YacG/DUF329 family)
LRSVWNGMKLQCPRCGKETQFENNSFRPFCSERCKVMDLGNWLSGAYYVPAATQEEEKEGEMRKPQGDSEDR